MRTPKVKRESLEGLGALVEQLVTGEREGTDSAVRIALGAAVDRLGCSWPAVENVRMLEQTWARRCNESDLQRAIEKVEAARIAVREDLSVADAAQVLDALVRSADSDLARALVRDTLRALGLVGREVSDLVPTIEIEEEGDTDFIDFAIERLEFSSTASMVGRNARRAYAEWLKAAGRSRTPPSPKAFANELSKSVGVVQATFGSDGKRERGWRGVGLKAPPPGRPGEHAKNVTAEFFKLLGSPRLAELVDEARRAAKRSRS